MDYSTELHLTPDQVAALWNCDVKTVRNLFGEMAGVLRFKKNTAKGKLVRTYLRIPLSLVEAEHRRRSGR